MLRSVSQRDGAHSQLLSFVSVARGSTYVTAKYNTNSVITISYLYDVPHFPPHKMDFFPYKNALNVNTRRSNCGDEFINF